MKLNVETLEQLMLLASTEHPENPLLHRALLSARNRLQEIDLAAGIERQVDFQKAVDMTRAQERHEKLQNDTTSAGWRTE